jgi:hypothetical protein
MTKSRPPKTDDSAQYKRFFEAAQAQYKRSLDAAREAGADETEEGADRASKEVAKPIGRPAARGPRTSGRSPK